MLSSVLLQHQGYGFRGLSRFGFREVTVKLLQTQIHHRLWSQGLGQLLVTAHACVTGVAAGWWRQH